MNCCNCIHTVTSITVQDGVLVLGFNTPPIVHNTRQFRFRIPCNLGAFSTTPLPVNLSLNVNGSAVNVPLLNMIANQSYSNEVRTCVVYNGRFGSFTTNHVIAYNLQ